MVLESRFNNPRKSNNRVRTSVDSPRTEEQNLSYEILHYKLVCVCLCVCVWGTNMYASMCVHTLWYEVGSVLKVNIEKHYPKWWEGDKNI